MLRLRVLRIHCGYIPLWRLLHYWLPEYLTTTSLLETKLHWFSSPLLDKGDEFCWTHSHGGTSPFPAFKVNYSFNHLLPHSLALYSSDIFSLPFDRCRHTVPLRTMCLCFKSVLYEEIVLQRPCSSESLHWQFLYCVLLPLSHLTFSSILH